jgi:hypothetical protein
MGRPAAALERLASGLPQPPAASPYASDGAMGGRDNGPRRG